MDKMITSLGAIVVGIGGIFFLVILSTLFGALAGWVVGLVFADTILGILAQIGIKNIAMWQFGAFMGFVGGFMKTKVTVMERK